MVATRQLVDIRFCENCGWIIPRRSYDGPSMYKKRKYCSQKCFGAVSSVTMKKNTDNYWTLHWRIRVARGPASEYDCEHCPEQAHDWAWLHDRDGQDVNDFIPLCRKCHVAYDQSQSTLSERGRKAGSSGWTDERRKVNGERARTQWNSLSPEEKIEINKRRWETRRRNQADKE